MPPARRSTVTWILGVVVVFVLAYITLNTLRTDAPGSRGIEAGSRLPPFAAPLATSKLDGDANLATKRDQGQQGDRPACEVRGPDIVNSCQLAERGPVVLAFFATRSARCEEQVDVLERVRRRYPDVGELADVRRIARKRHWGMPVGYDHDGAVSNAYAVAICPSVTFAYKGGRVEGTSLALIEGAALRERLEKLRRGP